MSAIQWEYDLVERPFCEQLAGMGWQWIEGDTQVPHSPNAAVFATCGCAAGSGATTTGVPPSAEAPRGFHSILLNRANPLREMGTVARCGEGEPSGETDCRQAA
jgi:hypothetical protein